MMTKKIVMLLLFTVLLMVCVAEANAVTKTTASANSGLMIQDESPPQAISNATIEMADFTKTRVATNSTTMDCALAAKTDMITTVTMISKTTSNAAQSDMTTAKISTYNMISNAAFSDVTNAPPTSTYRTLSNVATMADLRPVMSTHTSNGAAIAVMTNTPGGGADTTMTVGSAVEKGLIKDLEAAYIARENVVGFAVFSSQGSFVASRQQSQGNKEVSTQLKRPISKLAPFAYEADHSAGCSVRC